MKAFASAAKTSSKEKMMSEARKNGCHNLPRPTAETWYYGQDGTHQIGNTEPDKVLLAATRYVKINHAMTTECQYTHTTYDRACEGCAHRVMTEPT